MTGVAKIHPVFPLTSVLFKAFHVAPPVAVLSRIERKLTETVPDALDNVAAVPGVVLSIVSTFPEVPSAVKLVTVCVVPEVKRIDVAAVALYEFEMFANVLEPEIVSCPAPPWSNVIAPQLALPPAKVLAEELVIVTVAPEPETVKLVDVVQVHELVVVYVEAFKFNVLVLELLELKFAELTA